MLVIRTLTITHIYSMLTPLRHVNLYTLYYVSSDGWSRSSEPSAYEAAALPTELHRDKDLTGEYANTAQLRGGAILYGGWN